jgi:hypothetical protein
VTCASLRLEPTPAPASCRRPAKQLLAGRSWLRRLGECCYQPSILIPTVRVGASVLPCHSPTVGPDRRPPRVTGQPRAGVRAGRPVRQSGVEYRWRPMHSRFVRASCCTRHSRTLLCPQRRDGRVQECIMSPSFGILVRFDAWQLAWHQRVLLVRKRIYIHREASAACQLP